MKIPINDSRRLVEKKKKEEEEAWMDELIML